MTRTAKRPAKKRKTVKMKMKMKTWRGWCIMHDWEPRRVYPSRTEAEYFGGFARLARVEVREIVTKRSKA